MPSARLAELVVAKVASVSGTQMVGAQARLGGCVRWRRAVPGVRTLGIRGRVGVTNGGVRRIGLRASPGGDDRREACVDVALVHVAGPLGHEASSLCGLRGRSSHACPAGRHREGVD